MKSMRNLGHSARPRPKTGNTHEPFSLAALPCPVLTLPYLTSPSP